MKAVNDPPQHGKIDMEASNKTITSIDLTEDQRKQIARDLGLEDRLEKVPASINIAGMKSNDLRGAEALAGPSAAVAVIM